MPTSTLACATTDVNREDPNRFDHGQHTFCIYHAPDGDFLATDGLCSHEKVHPGDGLVMDHTVECPRHNALFDFRTGEAIRAPACGYLRTFAVKVGGTHVHIEI